MAGTPKRWWRRLSDRLAPSADAIEADELRARFDRMELPPIADARMGVPVKVGGTIRSVILGSRAQAPALEVDLYDGSESLTLVFLGRRAIRGVTPGRHLIVMGRITSRSGAKVMFNPAYELLPVSV